MLAVGLSFVIGFTRRQCGGVVIIMLIPTFLTIEHDNGMKSYGDRLLKKFSTV
jgi:uncharacterized membrane protein YphA (DoxX/SURF4 family)